MKKLLTILMLGFVFISALAGDNPKYPISTIPADLKEDVDVVVREETSSFKIISKSSAILHVHEVYTILNEKGKRFASETVGYDKLTVIKDFNASAYDALGKQIKKLKNSEFIDQSAYDGFSLYSDNRFKHADLTQSLYPYTVEFEYEIEFKYLFFIPTYTLLSAERVSIEKSSYTLVYPKDLSPRYIVQNIETKPQQGKSDSYETLSWSFEKIKPIKFEVHGPPKETVVSTIRVAPSHFSYEGYEGDMNSWAQFGQWINSLNKGRDILPEETVKKIVKLTSDLPTREEKIKAIYQYVQNKTRYVSIQLGIGGFQPFEASVVDNTGYGDCKALSNYTVAMLAAVGIQGHYVLIRAGENEVEMRTDFPSSQFNHAVVAVPNAKDTVWLECTSQTNPFGYMGTFTGSRKALLITEKGGIVVNTPKYDREQNKQIRKAEVLIDKSGNGKASVNTIYEGLQYENDNLDRIVNSGTDDQKKWIQRTTQIPFFDISSFNIKGVNDKIPSATVKIDLVLNRYASVSGKRIFITPNLMNRFTYVPEKMENRKTPVVRKAAYEDTDTISFTLPEEIYPEFVPEPVYLKNRFGEYDARFEFNQGKLTYIRKLKINKGEYPPDSYSELVEFYKSVNKADNMKLVFMNKT